MLKASAKLKIYTTLTPKVSKVTRWSSVLDMLERYVILYEYLEKLEINENDELIPSTVEHRKIENFWNHCDRRIQ